MQSEVPHIFIEETNLKKDGKIHLRHPQSSLQA